MDVEVAAPPREKPLVGPARAGQHGPVEAEAHEAHLPAVGVAREHEVDVVVGQIVERARVVEQQEPQVL